MTLHQSFTKRIFLTSFILVMSMFLVSASTEGANLALDIQDLPTGDIPWSNEANALILDNTFASALEFGSGDVSNRLFFKNFSFSIPGDATIDGIEIEIRVGTTSAVIDGEFLSLAKEEVATGDDKWTDFDLEAPLTNFTEGGSSDLWGTSWTPAQINSDGFGLMVAFDKSGTKGGADVEVAWAIITIHFTESGDSVFPTFTNIVDNNGTLFDFGNVDINYTVNNTNFTFGLNFGGVNQTCINTSAQVNNGTTVNCNFFQATPGVFTYFPFALGSGVLNNYNQSATQSYTINESATVNLFELGGWKPNDVWISLINGTNKFDVNIDADIIGFRDLDITGESIFRSNATSLAWFNGLFNWVIDIPSQIYFSFNGSTLSFNETRLNETIIDLGGGIGNLSWNESLADTLYAPNTTGGIQSLLNSTGVYSTFNATYDAKVTDNESWNESLADTLYLSTTGDTGVGDYEFNLGTFIINSSSATTESVFEVIADSLTTGRVASFYSNSAETNAREIVRITNDNTLATGATALHIQQDADAEGLHIQQTGNAEALNLDATGVTTATAVSFNALNSLTTGRGLHVESESTDTSTRNLVEFHQSATGATGATVLSLEQESNSPALTVVQTGGGSQTVGITYGGSNSGERNVLEIKNTNFNAANTKLLFLNQSSRDWALDTQTDSLTNLGGIARFRSNSSNAFSRNLVEIINENTAASGAITLMIRQDSTADILNLFDGGTEVFTVLDGGNVGIGTSSPITTFEVVGNSLFGGDVNSTGTFKGLFNWTVLTDWLSFDGATLSFNETRLNLTIDARSLNSTEVEGLFNSTSWNRSGTNVFLANIGDNVGIGTISPDFELRVNGTIRTDFIIFENNSNVAQERVYLDPYDYAIYYDDFFGDILRDEYSLEEVGTSEVNFKVQTANNFQGRAFCRPQATLFASCGLFLRFGQMDVTKGFIIKAQFQNQAETSESISTNIGFSATTLTSVGIFTDSVIVGCNPNVGQNFSFTITNHGTINSGVACSNVWGNVKVLANATKADFYVNGVYKGSLTNDLGAWNVSTALEPNMYSFSGGPTANFFVDYVEFGIPDIQNRIPQNE